LRSTASGNDARFKVKGTDALVMANKSDAAKARAESKFRKQQDRTREGDQVHAENAAKARAWISSRLRRSRPHCPAPLPLDARLSALIVRLGSGRDTPHKLEEGS
jgi:hypothetical protein